MAEQEKPKCPECGTEVVMLKEGDKIVAPKECAKCGFRLSGFSGFKRWFAAAAREYETDQRKKKAENKGEDAADFLDTFRDM